MSMLCSCWLLNLVQTFEIRRTQQFYKQYIKLVDGDEQVSILRGFTSNIDFYRFLIQ